MSTASWDPYRVPAPPWGSRFVQSISPAGWRGPSETIFVGVLARLAADRIAEAVPYSPRRLEVVLRQVSLVGGSYVLEERGVIARVPAFESRRPGRVWKRLDAGVLLDSFLLGGEAWEKAPDREVWEAARAVAEAHGFRGRGLRALNDHIAQLVCVRAGIDITGPDSLPPLHRIVR
jgi:hypothetical protein